MFQRYFSKVVCLSLDSRPDRREHFDAQARNIGLEFEYYKATPKTEFQLAQMRPLRGSGHNLATYAHNFDLVNLLENCLSEGIDSLLFLEDDCVFEENALEVFERLHKLEMPVTWDLFYLGAWHRNPPVKEGDLLYRVTRAHLSHAVIIHKMAMPLLIHHCRKNAQLFDQILADIIHPRGRSYCLFPDVAKQADGYSSIWETDVKQSERRNTKFRV